MIGLWLIVGMVLLGLGGACSTVTMEAAPGKPRKEQLSWGVSLAWNVTAAVLIVAGLVCVVVVAIVFVLAEVPSWM